MKILKSCIAIPILLMVGSTVAQSFTYSSSETFPFGKPNPEAPTQIKDFDELIGTCDCKSVARVNQTAWADTVKMTWTFKYIMNGMAVQDETLKADGAHSGSIRQYNPDSARWYVHYYSTAPASGPLGVWEGGKKGNKIVLYKDSPAPNGTPGFYRLTFSDISIEGFNWIGEWTDKSESFSYPTWKIFCTKRP